MKRNELIKIFFYFKVHTNNSKKIDAIIARLNNTSFFPLFHY